MKEFYNNLTNFLSQFFDNTLVEIITTIIFVVLGNILIIEKTEIGKKKFNELTNLLHKSSSSIKETEGTMQKYLLEKEKEIKELKDYYEEKLSLCYLKYNKLNDFLITVAENINNVKVKKALNDYLELIKDEKELVVKEVENLKLTFEEKLNHLEEVVLNGKENEEE